MRVILLQTIMLTTLNNGGGGDLHSLTKYFNTIPNRAPQSFLRGLPYFSSSPCYCGMAIFSTAASSFRLFIKRLSYPLCLRAKKLRHFFSFFANARKGYKTFAGCSPRRRMSMGFLQILREKTNDVLSWCRIISGKGACLYRPGIFCVYRYT